MSVILNLFNKQKKLMIIALLVLVFSFFVLFKLVLFAQASYDPTLFVTRWQTNVAGATEPTKVTLNFQLSGMTGYYEVDWTCDGNFDEVIYETKTTHDYKTAGTYDICIRSLAPIAFYAPGLTTDEKAKLLEIKQWGNIKWSSFNRAFQSMVNMKLTATDIPDLSQVKDMNYAFEKTTNFEGHTSMNRWDTKNVTSMAVMFRDTPKFNAPIGNWNTGKVTTMHAMFNNASSFNQNIGSWNTINVINMSNMFSGATKFDQPIGNWKTENVINMAGMFMNTPFNQDITSWNTNSLTNMGYMFKGATAFNQPIGNWNVSKVSNMDRLFENAVSFNQPLNSWDTSSTTVMSGMFRGAILFNQPINNWNTANVTNMITLLNNAKAFNQDLSSWNVEGVTDFTNFLSNSGLKASNYDKLLNSWRGQNVKSDLAFGAEGIYYCNAKPAKDFLTNTYNWNITDAGKNCPPTNLSLDKTEIDENSTVVGEISAVDEAATIIYTLVSGEGSDDNQKFALNPTTGQLVFLVAPDFENPEGSADPNNRNKYTIRVRATDPLGQYSEAVFVITVKDIDDVGPVITFFPGVKVAKGFITSTEFEVSDRFSIASVGLDTSSVAAIYPNSITCWPTTSNTTSTDFSYKNNNPVPGNHLVIRCKVTITTSGSLILYATDDAGHTSIAEEPGYIIDTFGPTFTVANVSITSSGSIYKPTVSFKAEDPTGVTGYGLTFFNTSSTKITIPINYVPGIISRVIELDPSKVSHGVEITAYDNTGNSTSRRITFPPVIEINAPTIISNEAINDTTVKITASTSSHKITNIGLFGEVAGAGASITECKGGDGGTTTPYVSPVNCKISGIKKTGMLEVQANETGIAEAGKNLQKYFYDTEAPKIIISAPTKAKNNDITDVTITVTDKVDLFADDISIHASTTAGIAENKLFCNTDHTNKSIVNCTLTITSSGNLVIEAKDKAKNSSIARVDNFIIDKIPPVVTINNPAKVNFNNQVNYTLSGGCTVDDNDPVVIMITQPYMTRCTNGINGGVWSLPIDLSTYSDGDIYVSVKQTDAVGNEATATTTLEKDIIPPIVKVSLGEGQINPTNINSVKFNISFSEPINEATFSKEDIVITGSMTYQKGNLRKIGDNKYELEVNNLTDGETVTINIPAGVCTDLFGNNNLEATSLDRSVTYDNTPPTLTINQSSTQTDPAKTDSIKYTVIFSEKIREATFTKEDIILSGSTTAEVKKITKINDTEYEVEVSNLTAGDIVTANIPANVLTDLATNLNQAATFTDNTVTYSPDPVNNTNTGKKSSGCFACFVNPLVPKDGFAVKINNNATTTANRKVTLTFNAGKDVKKMAISMTDDFTKATQEDYTPTKQWDLCLNKTICPDGKYTVYVKFYTLYGRSSNEALTHSTITLKSDKIIKEEANKVSCQVPLYPKTPIKYGSKDNNPAEVKLLQEFLNTYEEFNLKIDGIYSSQTREAVIKWQERYADEVLKPWGLSKGTGYVYTTTLKKIKAIHEAKCIKDTPKPEIKPNNKYIFTRDLYTGITGTDVKQLQMFLNTHGFILTNTGPGSPGNETEKFGAFTRQALSRFQVANNISPTAGYFGIITRNKVNSY